MSQSDQDGLMADDISDYTTALKKARGRQPGGQGRAKASW